jgi:hypothetical protein
METAVADPQVLVLATRLKGEVTWTPLAGVVTVMADAGTLIPKVARVAKRKVLINMPRVLGPHALALSDCGLLHGYRCKTAGTSMNVADADLRRPRDSRLEE